MNRLLLLIITVHISIGSIAQDSLNTFFYEMIKEDSVVMFFDKAYNFTGKDCFIYQRFTRIDQGGNFFQSVLDLDSSNKVFGKGWYTDGKKNGRFETYYPNGQIKSEGLYESDNPVGDWNYFYPNSNKERHIRFSGADTLLLDFYDKNGKQLVIDGNGNFEGPVAAMDRFYNYNLIASGQIVNGKPHGKWTSRMYNSTYCNETFEMGRFISGIFPNAAFSKNKTYTNRSFLNTLFLPSYFNRLEEFHVNTCSSFYPSRNNSVQKKNDTYNIETFRSLLNDAIDRILKDDFSRGKSLDYNVGENVLKIAFFTGENGSPTNFRQITSWGDQYYNQLVTILSQYAKVPTASSVLYFNLIITTGNSNTTSYKYYFSSE